MTTNDSRIVEIFRTFNETIKPLIAEVEAVKQKFPIELLNEIRALFDHIARCYLPDSTEATINQQLRKAESHITRILLDCYKNLILYEHDLMVRFDKQSKSIDLFSIDNGSFARNYFRLRKEAIHGLRNAKRNENSNSLTDEEKIGYFADAYHKYLEVEILIDDKYGQVKWASIRYRIKTIFHQVKTAAVWLSSLILGAIAGAIVSDNWTSIKSFFVGLFK